MSHERNPWKGAEDPQFGTEPLRDMATTLAEARRILAEMEQRTGGRGRRSPTPNIPITGPIVDSLPLDGQPLTGEYSAPNSSEETVTGRQIALGCAVAAVAAIGVPVFGAIMTPFNVLSDIKGLLLPRNESQRGEAAKNLILQDGIAAGIGAAIGTFILPGLGTLHGAIIGAAVPNFLRGCANTLSLYGAALRNK